MYIIIWRIGKILTGFKCAMPYNWFYFAELLQPVTMLRRIDGTVNFARNWTEYKDGFGDRDGNMWLGLESIHLLTTAHDYGLRVDITSWNDVSKYTVYSNITVGPESDGYRLHVSGYDTSSTADANDLV